MIIVQGQFKKRFIEEFKEEINVNRTWYTRQRVINWREIFLKNLLNQI